MYYNNDGVNEKRRHRARQMTHPEVARLSEELSLLQDFLKYPSYYFEFDEAVNLNVVVSWCTEQFGNRIERWDSWGRWFRVSEADDAFALKMRWC